MKRLYAIAGVGLVLGVLFFSTAEAQENQKLGQTSFKFLSVVSDARAAALAGAVTSLQSASGALFFNPAGMSGMDKMIDLSMSNNEWIADIQHYTVGMALRPAGGKYGIMGVSLQYVDFGNFLGTVVSRDPANPKGYEDTGLFSLNAYAVGIGYARELTDRFSVGGQVRLAHQDLGQSTIPNEFRKTPIYDSSNVIIGYADSSITASNRLNPLVFDFGTQFKTGVKSLVFGMSVRNFSKEIQYVYEQFQLPLVFTLGISMNLMELLKQAPADQSLIMSVDASHYRDHPEQVKVGLEYRAMNMLAVRGGYQSNSDENNGFSFGVGVCKSGFAFDYAYTPYGVFDKVQRMTARIAL